MPYTDNDGVQIHYEMGGMGNHSCFSTGFRAI